MNCCRTAKDKGDGMKAGGIDPRCGVSRCFSVSGKALAVAGRAPEAIRVDINKTFYKMGLYRICPADQWRFI
jgi:hypothetical protein